MAKPISLIAAMDLGRGIGLNNALPWKMPRDMERFRDLTWKNPIIFGRKTWESINRPLLRRSVIVLTKQPNWSSTVPNLQVARSLEQALELAQACEGDTVFVGGGSQVYKEALPRCDRLDLTLVLSHLPADAHFPDWGAGGPWKVSGHALHEADVKNPHPCVFLRAERS